MLKEGLKELKKEKRAERVVVWVTPKTKKLWSQYVFALTGRKNKKYKNAEELLLAMIEALKEPIEFIKYG